MCGIVQTPTSVAAFAFAHQWAFRNLPAELVNNVALICEEVRIPQEACMTLLLLASEHLKRKEEFVTQVSFAIYRNGKRYVCETSVRDEAAMMHLAMAGSALELINQALKSYGMKFVTCCCCGSEMHSIQNAVTCLNLSHQSNIERANKVAKLRPEDVEQISDDHFRRMGPIRSLSSEHIHEHA